MPEEDQFERPEDEKIEAEMGAEEIANDMGLPAARRTADEGIAAMQKRIDYLRRQYQNMHQDARDTDSEMSLIREIREAEARLKEYQLQKDGRN